MARVKVHRDGWIALPATLRRKLRLATGDELEPTADGVLLRTVKPLDGSEEAEPNEAVQLTPVEAGAPVEPVAETRPSAPKPPSMERSADAPE
jgi:AbrB family looped-hinge helix DNA binding protein